MVWGVGGQKSVSRELILDRGKREGVLEEVMFREETGREAPQARAALYMRSSEETTV